MVRDCQYYANLHLTMLQIATCLGSITLLIIPHGNQRLFSDSWSYYCYTVLAQSRPSAASLAKQCIHRPAPAQPTGQRLLSSLFSQRAHSTGQCLLSSNNINIATTGTLKLLPTYLRPVHITRLIGQAAVQLSIPNTWSLHPVFHVSLLTLWSGPYTPEPLTVDVEGLSEWFQHILSHHIQARVRGRPQTMLLVKWKGFGDEHNTWQPDANLTADGRYENTKLAQYWQSLTIQSPPSSPPPQPHHRRLGGQKNNAPTHQAPSPPHHHNQMSSILYTSCTLTVHIFFLPAGTTVFTVFPGGGAL